MFHHRRLQYRPAVSSPLTRRPVDEIVASTQADGTPAAPPMKNHNNGKTTPISALVLAADSGGEK
jgi:hypothetical protein